VKTEKSVFHCFSCQAKGNILDLVAAVEKCSVRDAGLKLQQWFNLAGGNSGAERPSSPAPETDIPTGLTFNCLRKKQGINPAVAGSLRAGCLGLFGVGDHFGDNVGVVNNLEIEPPVLVDASLPSILRFVILLGVQRRVVEIGGEKPKLLVKSSPHREWRLFQASTTRSVKRMFMRLFV